MTPAASARLTKLKIDSNAARALADLGVEIYTHDRFYGLVADATTPHGYRLVGSAMTLRSLERKLAKRLRAASKL